MKILIANPGSTSYKCKLLDMKDNKVLFQAAVERIGDEEGIYSFQWGDKPKETIKQEIPDYHFAVNMSIETLQKFISIEKISAVGFKVVLAKDVTGCVELTDDVLKAMEDFMPLAPVHNQVYLTAISVFKEVVPNVPLVGLFETAFHTEMPPEAFLYGIPNEYYEKYGVRKYGFHGASHRYISEHIKEHYEKNNDNLRIISCHLGGSSSVAAIKNGVSVDTSMGMSPQSGLLNAKRVGDFDTFALLYIMKKENLSIEDARNMLISKGGVYGISELSGDFRDIEIAMNQGNKKAENAFKTFAYYVKRYIGEYMAVLNCSDFIVLTGGLGQNSPAMRKEILSNMENIGIVLDSEKNNQIPENRIISMDDSKVKIAVIPTDEEIVVAKAVKDFCQKK